MKNIFAAASLMLILTSCVSPQTVAQRNKLAEYATCKQYKRFVDSVACTKKIADADTVLLPYDTNLQEIIAMKEVLAEKVQAKKITEADARYQLSKRINELVAQEQQTRAMRSSAAAAWAASRPRSTSCTGFGNQVNCNTY